MKKKTILLAAVLAGCAGSTAQTLKGQTEAQASRVFRQAESRAGEGAWLEAAGMFDEAAQLDPTMRVARLNQVGRREAEAL
jgi:hypothetical protein